MDILYIYNGWKDGTELRYSLRSIDKNCKGYGRVFIVGRKPDWCSDLLLHIPYEVNENLYKENDITAALFHAVENSDISNRFLVCADDYFYIRPTDLRHYPIYRKGTLPDTTVGKESMGGWKYVQSLVNTRELLTKNNLPFENYCEHAMFLGDRRLMLKYHSIFEAAKQYEFGAVYDSIMANLIVANDKKAVVVQRKDNKVGDADSLEALQQRIGDTECFSTTEGALNGNIGAILRELFPEKCRFEK